MNADAVLDPPELFRVLSDPLYAQGAEEVFVSECCGWVVVATVRQAQCRECRQEPVTHVVPRSLIPESE